MNFKEKFNNKKNGYTLLFSVLVASLVLAIGVSILNISKKEFMLTTSARDSAMAFYAADSGIECAAYGDQEFGSFSETTDSPSGTLHCGEAMGAINPPPGQPATEIIAGEEYVRTFSVKFGEGDGRESCTDIAVVKKLNINGSFDTIIEARGYNFGWNPSTQNCDVQGPRKVERGVRLTY